MFEEIITEEEIKFNDLEKKVFKFEKINECEGYKEIQT